MAQLDLTPLKLLCLDLNEDHALTIHLLQGCLRNCRNNPRVLGWKPNVGKHLQLELLTVVFHFDPNFGCSCFGIEPLRYRLAAIPFLVATVPLGSGVSGMAQLLAIIAVFVAVLLFEKRARSGAFTALE